MKKRFSLLIGILLLSSLAFAQIPLKLEIKHKLGASDFHTNQIAQNSLMQDFEVNSLRYYLSQFSITHDGGQVTEVADSLVLVNVVLDSLGYQLIDLGDFAGTQIESIAFYMGVDSARNHLDPSAYGPAHPLANQSPSMHWGWAAGYFFLSFDGPCGQNLNEWYDLQCLGDENYFQTIVENPLVTNYGDEILISIEGDYRGLLHEMDISQSISLHGPFLWARDALVNASQHVFKPTLTASYTGIDKKISVSNYSVFPNPLQNGSELRIQPENDLTSYSLRLFDLTGKEWIREEGIQGRTNISLPFYQKGLFILSLIEEDGKISTHKISIE